MQESKKIKTLANHCTSTDIRFDIETNESLVNEPHDTFKLETALNLGNMVVLGGDQGSRIMKMASIHDILTEFVSYRLDVYNKRKVHQLAAFTAQIATLDERIRFVRMVVSRELVISSYNKAQLLDVLTHKHGFTSSNDLIHIPLYELTLDHVDALIEKQRKLTEQKIQLEKMEPQDMWLEELTDLEIELKKL
jgi:DNA topoisomerase-2